jgi:hypothetical protein
VKVYGPFHSPPRLVGTLVVGKCNMQEKRDVRGEGVTISVARSVLVQITAQTKADRDAHT